MTAPRRAAPHGPARYCGRDFTPAELDVIAQLAATLPSRAAISRAVCDALGWVTPDGRRKDMTARVALNRMAADGLITLPPPRNGNGNGRHPRHGPPGSSPCPSPRPPPPAWPPWDPSPSPSSPGRDQSRRWNQLIRDHHYLGYTPLAGAQIRYLVAAPAAGDIAALAFAASAWTCAPRDAFIGWDPATRRANLNLICGNARFLIRPDIHVPNLASRLLAAVTRRLPADWHARYGYAPVLAETFVDTGRFTGASYRAANWTPHRPAPKAAANSTAATNTPCPSRTSTSTPCTAAGGRSFNHPAQPVTPHGTTEYLRLTCPISSAGRAN